MRTRRKATIEDLRVAIHSLPRSTRIAMLEGIAGNDIIVGAYTDGHGICPMLAAHRHGGRTSLISFAKAWDRFAFAGSRVVQPRPATARELLVLRTHLEASLLEEDAPQEDLASAIEAHRDLLSRRGLTESPSGEGERPARPRPGDPDRGHELRFKPGWSWTRLFRRYDEYQWALEQVRSRQGSITPDEPPAPSPDDQPAHEVLARS
jgi:hypothetical protein